MIRGTTNAGRGARGCARLTHAQKQRRALEAAAAIPMPATCDVCVIGGGASGLAAAISAAEAGARVVVLERGAECGRTILATGNGRCNLANVNLVDALDASAEANVGYHNAVFAAIAMGERPTADIVRRFAALGLDVVEGGGGRLYPASRVAESVRAVMLSACERLGVVLASARLVRGTTRAATGSLAITYEERWDGGTTRSLLCASLVIATGGALTGGTVERADTGLGDDLAALGIVAASTRAVLAPLACTGVPAVLDGRRAHATVTLRRGDVAVAQEAGEVLFRTYGLSGVVMFNLSRVAERGDVAVLDLVPGREVGDLATRLRMLREGGIALDVALSGIVDPVIAAELASRARDAAGGACAPCAWREAARIAKTWGFSVVDVGDAAHAQVTRGGIDVACLDPVTLAARDERACGIFCCGEAVDVDGPCGGFNLAWSWQSGAVAGASAARYATGRMLR